MQQPELPPPQKPTPLATAIAFGEPNPDALGPIPAAAPIPKPYPVGFDEKAAWVTDLFLRLDGRRS